MSVKRAGSPELVTNPFIKKRNLEWSLELTGSSRDAEIDSSSDEEQGHIGNTSQSHGNPRAPLSPPFRPSKPPAAAVEAGTAQISDHLAYFSEHLSKHVLEPYPLTAPRLPVPAYSALYTSNIGVGIGASPPPTPDADPGSGPGPTAGVVGVDGPRGGSHFVIHQHDHPVAGTHYDLRLQINATSSASWAIMYGMPGDPNSARLNRNATETRVHCLWNHLVETASAATGSLLVWDTGTYEVLGRRPRRAARRPPLSHRRRRDGGRRGQGQAEGKEVYVASSDEDDDDEEEQGLTQQERLHRVFRERKIRVRLNGTRLPHNYVLNLRLTKAEDAAGRAKIGRKPKTRRRRGGMKAKVPEPMTSSESDSGPEGSKVGVDGKDDDEDETVHAPVEADQEGLSALERELRELEDEEVRKTNAYIGATNTIESVHQRKWYLSLDREACGFAKTRKQGRVVWEWANGTPLEKEQTDEDGRLRFPFYVRGVEVERSVITGRLGEQVLSDEGVTGYFRRKGWRAVLN